MTGRPRRHRRAAGRLGVLAVLVGEVLDRVVHADEPREQQVEVLDRGGRRADPPAGHHPDVVDREDVRGVGHRHQQRAVVGIAHGQRLVALGGLRADQVRRAHVEVEDRQVDEVQAEALGHHAGELVVAQDAALDQHEARGAPLRTGRRRRPPRRPRGRRNRGRRPLRRSSSWSARGGVEGAIRWACARTRAVRSPCARSHPPPRHRGVSWMQPLAWRCRPSLVPIGRAEPPLDGDAPGRRSTLTTGSCRRSNAASSPPYRSAQ
jgi:hypothetical protein